MTLDYRRDHRTVEQFQKDIEVSHKIEREIIELYADYVEKATGQRPRIEDRGVDNSGKLLKHVNSVADFMLDGELFEVKFIRSKPKKFHIKAGHVKSYIKQNANVLFVMGWDTTTPEFMVMTPMDLLNISNTQEPKPFYPWGNKLVYSLNVADYQWELLKGDSDEIQFTN